MSAKTILLTGGTGYIASHTAAVLHEAGYGLVLYDNLSNSQASVVDRLQHITATRIPFVEGDIRDTAKLAAVLQDYEVDAVVHFAGLKAVGESVEKPLMYYDNNIVGSIHLLKAMDMAAVKKLVFSSSATVYGHPQYLPLDEAHPVQALSPYGRNKQQIEEILADIAVADKGWRIASLRYFNPVGAHQSALIGEDPNGIPNNLMPFIAKVASGKLPMLSVFGGDYPTADGTGVRDYIHVMDLADGHLAALAFLDKSSEPYSVYNLGTGQGYSVLEMIAAFNQASGQKIPYQIVGRRSGDVAACYADATKAKIDLGWSARRTLEDMCDSVLKFQQQYATSNSQ